MIKSFVIVASFTLLMVACAVTEQPETMPAAAARPEAAPAAPAEAVAEGVSYASNIQPIMLESCTPCHYPEKGKKELLDTYDATARFIDDIIYRIQLPTDDKEFMPYMSKKMPLTADQIQLFIDWRDAGLPD